MAIPASQQINQKKFHINHPLYKKWRAMKLRCYAPKNASYAQYGGRGIKVCDAWMNYNNFEKDMFFSYKKGLSLDRIDNNKDYSLENCRWATAKEQGNNRRNNHLFEYKGIEDTLTNWANYFKQSRPTLYSRIVTWGWPIEKALFTGNKG